MRGNRIGIIGCGRVGTALALALDGRARARPSGVCSRTRRHALALARRLRSARVFPGAATLAAATDLVVICVPDSALPSVVEELRGGTGLRGRTVLHTSGAYGNAPLLPLARQGAAVGSLHPLLAFPPSRRRAPLPAGTWFAVGGGPRGLSRARALVRELGGRAMAIPDGSRPAYHLAASIVANHTTVLSALALEVAARRGSLHQKELRAPLASLLRSVADRLEEEGPVKALTGPAARGDRETIRRHLDLLRGLPAEVTALYSLLSARAVAISAARDDLPPRRAAEILRLLLGSPAKPR